MALAARVQQMSSIDRSSLRMLEANFIAPEFHGRDDIGLRQAKLARIVSREIVPRLLHLHSITKIDDIIPATGPSGDEIDELAHIVLGDDLGASAAYVAALRDRGLAMDTLFVELLEPTARHLGEMWDNDECDFIDVTLGVARLQKLLAIFNCTHDVPALHERRQVLMAMTPGDQHYFGVTMVEKFLRAGGWAVHGEHEASSETIETAVRQRWFAVAGFTLGSDRRVNVLRDMISAVRACSANRGIGIMVGGPLFNERPELVAEVGADATAPNAPSAVLVTQKLFDKGALSDWGAPA